MAENYDWNAIAQSNHENNPWGSNSDSDGYDLKELIDINQVPVLLTGLNANTQAGLENTQAPDLTNATKVMEAVFPNNAEMFDDVMHAIGGSDSNAIARWWSYSKREIGDIIYALDQFLVVKTTYQSPLTNVYVYDCDSFKFNHENISDDDIFGGNYNGQR